jgi:hypothetical protein
MKKKDFVYGSKVQHGVVGHYTQVYYSYLIRRSVASGGRVGRNAPPIFENFVFFSTSNRKKSTFSRLFSYSIYLKEDITISCFLKI